MRGDSQISDSIPPTDEPTVRPCTENDVAQIARLAELMGKSGPAQAVAGRIERIRSLDDHRLCVAELIGHIVGYAWAQDYGPHLRTGESIARIHDLFVAPPARRGGVGSALFSHVRDWAGGRGIAYLQWQASRDALPFYRALGLDGDPCPDSQHPFFEIVFKTRDQ